MAQHTVADQLHAVKAAKKGKQKGGKKAAGRNAKGPRAAPSSMAPPANTEDGITVEFFVAAPEDKHDDALEAQGDILVHNANSTHCHETNNKVESVGVTRSRSSRSILKYAELCVCCTVRYTILSDIQYQHSSKLLSYR